LQLLAALTSDRKSAALCNVIDTGHREDAYTGIYEAMLSEVGETAKITRGDCKDAIMTSLYNSTAMPKRIFGDSLVEVFYDTMARMCPGAWELKEAFMSMWDPSKDCNSWVLPDNFHVHVKVMDNVKETVNFLNQPFEVFYYVNQPMESGRSLGANSIHSVDGMVVREITRRCDYDPIRIAKLKSLVEQMNNSGAWELDDSMTGSKHDDAMVVILWDHYQNTGYLSARILDYLNCYNLSQIDGLVIGELLDSLPEKPFKVVSIHDCFRCLPTYGDDLRRQYNLQLSLIAQSDLLGNLISQIIGKPVRIGKLDKDLHIEILESNYSLS
jgi:hypothetical protein